MSAARPSVARTLVIGLGNPILSDDAVGLRVARALRDRLADRPDVEVDEDYRGGLQLMERLIGYSHVILIDAIRTNSPPGAIRQLTLADLPTRHSGSSHDLSLPEALVLGRSYGADVPSAADVRVVAIEADEVETFSETCTPAVERSIPRAVELVLELLSEGRLKT